MRWKQENKSTCPIKTSKKTKYFSLWKIGENCKKSGNLNNNFNGLQIDIMAMLDIPHRVVVYLCGLSLLDTCMLYLCVNFYNRDKQGLDKSTPKTRK